MILKSDQKALRWLLKQKVLSWRQYRWLDDFQSLNLKLEWVPGKGNHIADALSRKRHDIEIGIQVNALDDNENEFSPSFLSLVREETPKDKSLAEIYEAVTTTKPLT